ncbi:MAG: methyltransferase [Oligoflexia bacterium]|nr:methyltransferase [Oligoflexia bacterium]
MSKLSNVKLLVEDDSLFLSFETLDSVTVSELISIVRTIKQTNAKRMILNLNSSISIFSPTNFNDRLNWSKNGQILTTLISASPIPVIASIENEISGELAELAFSCLEIFTIDGGKIKLSKENEIFIPCWGSLDRLSKIMDRNNIKKVYSSLGTDIWNDFIDKKKIKAVDSSSFKKVISEIDFENALFSLSSYHFSKKIGDKNSLNFLETTTYLSSFESDYFERIKYIPLEQIEGSLMDGDIKNNIDDFGNDFMTIDSYPNLEEKVLKRKNRIEEVTRIVNDPSLDIKGKCIELGSGYGYFSMLLSKRKEVSDVVAFDISVAETNRFGPFVRSLINPDMSKITYKVGDFNKLSDEYGQYDVVVFCASLHHSSDIPKSLEIANKLLKKGGKVILHGEHYRPMFLGPNKKNSSGVPNTIKQFSRVLVDANFTPKVFRYALKGRRLYMLKKFLFEMYPFKLLNGWFKIANFLMYGIKN